MLNKHQISENIKFMNSDNTGSITDGYHTFDELYYHRMILTAALVKVYSLYSWKSKKHSDGTMYDNYFIVGIDTDEGQAIYHYHMKYWDLFHCKELKQAPNYDGHTPTDAIERIRRTYIKGDENFE